MKLELHKNLRTLIEREGITASQLSRACNVSNQTLNNWLNGQEPRNLMHLKQIADYFGVTVDFLLYETNIKKTCLKKKLIEPIEEFEDEINAGVFEIVLRRVRK